MVVEPGPAADGTWDSSTTPCSATAGAEPEFSYLRVVDPVSPDAYIKGVVRHRVVEGHPRYEIFTRSSGWKNTVVPWEHELGRAEVDLADISPAAAHALVERIEAHDVG